MAYGDFKDLPRRVGSDKVLHDRTFNIAKNMMVAAQGLASMVYKCCDKKSSCGTV